MSEQNNKLRGLPKIDDLLRRVDVEALDAPRWAVRETLRSLVEERRQAILGGESPEPEIAIGEIEAGLVRRLRSSLRTTINATGVVLHTNLGRAPLAPVVAERAAEISAAYSNLEYDIDQGRRGSRHGHATELLRQLTGAEDAVVVNNNASAVMLGLAALATNKEVVVSRGELVEIGGSFRVPDVMRLSNAHLVEVGTTNKTRIADYEAAISEETALLLQIHKSNFAVVGFTEDTPLDQIVELAESRELYSMVDLGSGSLVESARLVEWGLPPEPSVRSVVESGVQLCTFSGDKLLGGPQAGVLVGTSSVIAQVRKHPLMRALRPDKLTLASLCATLELYRDARESEVPTVAMLSVGAAELEDRARRLASALTGLSKLSVEVRECESAVGGGAMPLARLPSYALTVSGVPPATLDRLLREAEPAVIGRIHDERFLLDVRTLFNEAQCQALFHGLRALDEALP